MTNIMEEPIEKPQPTEPSEPKPVHPPEEPL